MSRWNDWGYFESAPLRPPPAHGIRIGGAGSTWWGKCWIEALERVSYGYSTRLSRGKTYARAGRVHDLVVRAGTVEARVTGSRPKPYEVRIRLMKLDDMVWKKALGVMAAKAKFSAELLDGSMPHDIESAFRDTGTTLFPVRARDLAAECSCPDGANPCKHAAAVHYVLGDALDRDPFLLFELRGRTKEQVLDGLRAARAGKASGREPSAPRLREQASDVPSVDLGSIDAAAYDAPRAPLPALHLAFEAPAVSGSLLRQLGAPAGWSNAATPEEFFGPIVRAAAEKARWLAMAEAGAKEAEAGGERK